MWVGDEGVMVNRLVGEERSKWCPGINLDEGRWDRWDERQIERKAESKGLVEVIVA